jgi:hypothetical protein
MCAAAERDNAEQQDTAASEPHAALGRDPRGGHGATMLRHLLYNSGRLTTYCFLGVLAGALGQVICTRHGATVNLLGGSLNAAEQMLAIVAGLLMIAMALQFFGMLRAFHRLAIGFGTSTLATSLRSLLTTRSRAACAAALRARFWRVQRLPAVSAGLRLNGSFTHILCGNYAAANAEVDELVALADKKGALLWRAFGMSMQGCLLALTVKASDAVHKVWASVPRPDVKLDQAIARNSKRRNPVEFRSGAVGKIVWWSDPDEPFLALHRPEALADAPMTRHVGEYKSPFLQVHNPQSRRAIREGQFGLFHAGFSARCARPDDFTIWRKRLRLQILSGELNHGVCGHGHPPFCATAQEPEPGNVFRQYK